MSFVLVEGEDTSAFEAAVNAKLEDGYVFAGNVIRSDGGWAMPMIQFKEDNPMDTRLAKQLWGMFIARLF
jgi:hypothetical protein